MNVYFLSFVGPKYSRTGVLLNFPSPLLKKHYIHLSSQTYKMIYELIRLRKNLEKDSSLVVMSPSNKITIFAKVITGKKIFLDAGWPLIDGYLSRGVYLRNIFKLVGSYILDFLSFHSASFVILESQSQLIRVNRLFVIPKRRLSVGFTGFNETAFTFPLKNSLLLSSFDTRFKFKSNMIKVIFRGRINNESGIQSIIDAAKILIDEAEFIFVTNEHKVLSNLPNNCHLFFNISEWEMSHLYEIANVALGQISDHKRLRYTIPHKAFEAGYFGKCYISARSIGLLELYSDKTVYLISNPFVGSLVCAIRALKDDNLRRNYEEFIKKSYQSSASQKLLNENFQSLIMTSQLE